MKSMLGSNGCSGILVLLIGLLLGNVFFPAPRTAFAQEVTNVEALLNFAELKDAEWRADQLEVKAFARKHRILIREVHPDGSIVELVKIQNDIPIYFTTNNQNAATSTRTDKLWAVPFSVTGLGYSNLGEWDSAGVRLTHVEFGGRVTQEDTPSSTSSHSTHVAGTLIASGVDVTAKGMAPQMNLKAYDWSFDEGEMAAAAAAGMEVSNHSYGIGSGWSGSTNWYGDTAIDQDECWWFGFYRSLAQDWDQIAYDAPYYLTVISAGNDRNDTAPLPGTAHEHNGSGSYTDTHFDDGWDNGGFDTVGPKKVAKNVLTVGAVNDVSSYTGPNSVQITSFSGWGPTDDGRIKPDIVGNGASLWSTDDDNDSDYTTKSGTSMAAPNVTGTLALLQQYYQQTHGASPMRSATLKALAIGTADECGNVACDGPDYVYGWGLLNAEAAAELIADDAAAGGGADFWENSLAQGETAAFQTAVVDPGLNDVKVTLVWTDLPGTPPANSLDPTNKMLVNDLDLRLIRQADGQTFYPWVLDPSNPTACATTGDNDLDNVEQIFIESAQTGIYLVEVSHKGTLMSPPQAFSIVLSGLKGQIFVDGFESGDVSAWSSSVN